VSDVLLAHPDLGGVHFTGSTGVFNGMWETIGRNMGRYRSYPRIVGETGGKDFILAHPSADPPRWPWASCAARSSTRGRSARRRAARTCRGRCGPTCKERVVAMMRTIRQGDVRDFRNFMGAVIDERSFTKIQGYLDDARRNATVVQGGGGRPRTGWFVEPTLVETADPGTGCCARRSSAPCSPSTRTTTRAGRRRWRDRPHVALRAHRRGVRRRPARGEAGERGAAQRGRQLLHQRQAHRRGRRDAAVRRRARLGDQRQGRLQAQPPALDQPAHREGDARAAHGVRVPVHGGGRRRARRRGRQEGAV
jgi:hypothetical protein